MSNKIKAKIEQNRHGTGLWVIIEYGNELEDFRWPITEEEVLPIRDAIDEYMLNGLK